ncbi:hypothetical protein NECID01_0994 [Nematocida sp. AWRm77]|nr:hypothetical protein NECID01_0994 [Nematocida sp. AWRm77]
MESASVSVHTNSSEEEEEEIIPDAETEEESETAKEAPLLHTPPEREQEEEEGPPRSCPNPLKWRHKIEEYADESYRINDLAVLRIFRDKIEKVYTQRRRIYDQYYNQQRETPQRRHLTSEDDLMLESKKLIETRLVTVRDRLRSRIIKERHRTNLARRLHVKMKQVGYDTEGARIYSLLAREVVLQKNDIVKEMERIVNKLTALYSKVLVDARYAQKCAEFLERKIQIRYI